MKGPKGKKNKEPAPLRHRTPPAQAQAGRAVPQRAPGGVPPPQAFDNIRRRPPPNLPIRQGALPYAERPRNVQKAGERAQVPQGRDAGVNFPKEDAEKSKKKKPPRPRNPARRRLRRRIAAGAAAAVIITAGVMLSVGLLFKISGFELRGESRYTVEQVAQAFGHAPGDNMYGFSVSAAQERVLAALPYIDSVRIRRMLPGTVVFEVTPAGEEFCLAHEGGYAVLSARRKTLAIAAEKPPGLTEIMGLTEVTAVPGAPLALTESAAAAASALSAAGFVTASSDAGSAVSSVQSAAEPDALAEDTSQAADSGAQSALPGECFAAFEALIGALNDAGIGDITWLDVGDPLNLSFCWEERITVRLGPKSNLSEKLAAAKVLMTDTEQPGIDRRDVGTLDMSYYIDTGRSYFSPQ